MTNHFNQIEGGHAAFNGGLLPIPLTARGNGLLEQIGTVVQGANPEFAEVVNPTIAEIESDRS